MGKNKEEIDRKIGNVFRKGEVWGTEEQKNRGTGEQRNTRTEEQKNRGTGEQGNRRTEEQRNRGTEEQRNRRTEEQRNRGTEEQRNRGTEEQRKWAIRLFASLREGGKRPYGSSLRSEKVESGRTFRVRKIELIQSSP